MIRWPWASLQALNLDWILAKLKEVVDKVNAYSENITASATTGAAGTNASVTVTGDLDTGLDFAFTIPRGNTGATGANGRDGVDGESFKILGLVATTAQLPANPSPGDCYAVGDASNNTCYNWNGSSWQNIGPFQAVGRTSKVLEAGSYGAASVYDGFITKIGNDLHIRVPFAPTSAVTAGSVLAKFTWDSDIPYDSNYADYDNWNFTVAISRGPDKGLSMDIVRVTSSVISIVAGEAHDQGWTHYIDVYISLP